MNKIIYGTIISIFTLISQSVLSEDQWTLTDDGRLYTRGEVVHNHKLVFMNNSDNCSQPNILLSWSTYNDGIQEFEGRYGVVEMYFGLKRGLVNFRVLTTYKSPIGSLIMFDGVQGDKNLMNLMEKYDNLSLRFIGPKDLTDTLDIKEDDFNIYGFKEGFKKLQRSCVTKTQVVSI